MAAGILTILAFLLTWLNDTFFDAYKFALPFSLYVTLLTAEDTFTFFKTYLWHNENYKEKFDLMKTEPYKS